MRLFYQKSIYLSIYLGVNLDALFWHRVMFTRMAHLAGILRCRGGAVAFVSVALAVLCFLSLSLLGIRLMRTVGRGIGQPEAFCAGTTAAYRKGNGTNSALTPLITPAPIGQPCLDPVSYTHLRAHET